MIDSSGPRWRKSSFSDNAASCVEIAHLARVLGVRDSKNVDGPSLSFPPSSFAIFLRSL
ncbi:DUF397 domain-containing protein [Kibdelosporangium persicum]|uniref:DUF397 domain-containing protein n=1 Tax=Kibdelosporangium persicum TaxID=2698649 RepID=UPI001564D8EA|nr:DUF397 domain-containing protein [Kibdelosporangium persicum]